MEKETIKAREIDEAKLKLGEAYALLRDKQNAELYTQEHRTEEVKENDPRWGDASPMEGQMKWSEYS